MSPERSNAYRRVMKTLDDLGPSKLLETEQQRIRYAADNLIFAGDLSTARYYPDGITDAWWPAALTLEGKISNFDITFASG